MNIPFVTRNEWTLNFIDEDGYAQVCSGPRSPFRDGARPVSPVFARILPRFRASSGVGGGAVVAMLSLAAQVHWRGFWFYHFRLSILRACERQVRTSLPHLCVRCAACGLIPASCSIPKEY